MLDFEAVSENIFRLEIPWRLYGVLNLPVAVWLVWEPEGWTMIDAGPPETADQVISAVARLTSGRGPARVILTHGHYDHSGGLETLRAAWNPAILCHRDEVPFVTGETDYRFQRSRSPLFWLTRLAMKPNTWALPVARDLERGQSVVGMAVIHLPGHTPGQIGLLHPSDHAMICGDAVMNLGGRLSPPPAVSTPDPPSARASIERLAELDFLHLLPSHGPPILNHGHQALLEFLQRNDAAGPELRGW